MSYDLCYHDEEGIVKVPPHTEGGTIKFVRSEDLIDPMVLSEDQLNADAAYKGYLRTAKNQEVQMWPTNDDVKMVPGNDAELNITYNYSSIFPFRGLDGKVGEEVLDELEDAVKILGTERDEDYWATTPGNVGHTLSILVGWIKLHPKAVFSIY
jgi:hypothetical protein